MGPPQHAAAGWDCTAIVPGLVSVIKKKDRKREWKRRRTDYLFACPERC